MINKWELVNQSTKDFPNRWQLMLEVEKAEATELGDILSHLNYTCGRVFAIREQNYQWAFYLYHLSEAKIAEIKNIMEEYKNLGADFDINKYLAPTAAPAEVPLIEETAVPKEEVSEEQKLITLMEIGLNPRYSFGNFVVGKNNHFAQAAALAVAELPGKVYNPLFIYGDVGLGKTHLMQAIGYFVLGNNPKAKIIYTTAERFMAEVIDAIRYGKIIEFRNKHRKLDLLLIDDIQFLSEAEAAQEEFYHTFNALYDAHKQIVIASDKPPKKISVLEERLRSRFEWGLITDLQSPNLETRVAILKKKVEMTKINIQDEVLYFIAERLKTNIRELEGFLIRLVAYSSLTKREISRELAVELLQDLLPEETVPSELEKPLPSLEKVVSLSEQEVATPEKVTPTEVEPSLPPVEKVESLPEVEVQKPEEKVITPEAKPEITPTPAPPPPTAPTTPAAGSKLEEGIRSIKVGYFYPVGREKELELMVKNFNETIKKHKIKFHLEKVFDKVYQLQVSFNFSILIEACRLQAVDIAILLGPPPLDTLPEAEFVRSLHLIFDKEKIPLQYVSFDTVPKQYKYLNMVLDFAFLKR